MRQKRVNSISFIASWPSKFSLLELLILLTGIGIGLFLYFRMEQVRIDSLNASSFNQETNELLLSISLVNNNFNSLLQAQRISTYRKIYMPGLITRMHFVPTWTREDRAGNSFPSLKIQSCRITGIFLSVHNF